jgi:hypothetical protein
MNKFIALLFIIFLSLSHYSKSNDQDTLWKHNGYETKLENVDFFSFSPDDSLVIASRTQEFTGQANINTLYRMQTVTGKVLNKYYPIVQARYTPDGNYIIGKYKDSLILLTADSLIKIERFQAVEKYYPSFEFLLDFNADYSKIYSNNTKGVGYRIWDFASGNIIKDTSILNNESGHIYRVDDLKIINEDLALFEVKEQIGYEPFAQVTTKIMCVDLNADTIKYKLENITIKYNGISTDRSKFCGSTAFQGNNILTIFDSFSGSIIDTLPLTGLPSAFTHDDKYLVVRTAIPIGSINVYDVTTKELKYSYHLNSNNPYQNFAISNSDMYIAAVNGAYSYLYYNRWQTNGIMGSAIDNQMISYPNPATDFIEISVGAGSEPALTGDLRIYDVFGQPMSTPVCFADTPASWGQFRIDVSGLAAGVYFVRIGDRVGKFVKI